MLLTVSLWFTQLAFLYKARTTSSRVALPTVDWDLLNQDNAPYTCPQVMLMEAVLQLRFSLTRAFQFLSKDQPAQSLRGSYAEARKKSRELQASI